MELSALFGPQQREMATEVAACRSGGGSGPGRDVLGWWAEKLSGRAGKRAGGMVRFAFYGRVSTEDWQDPVTSRARQLQQAVLLAAGAGVITAEFFDTGEYERTFYGSQYASMAPLFEHCGVSLWMPEVGGRVSMRVMRCSPGEPSGALSRFAEYVAVSPCSVHLRV